jgi:hypothetical protein
MSMSINELRRITARLYDHLEERGVKRVELGGDYYWSIPREQRLDVTKEPTEHTLGQLSDDLSELARIGNGDAEPIAYALVWLSSVLRELGETTIG